MIKMQLRIPFLGETTELQFPHMVQMEKVIPKNSSGPVNIFQGQQSSQMQLLWGRKWQKSSQVEGILPSQVE